MSETTTIPSGGHKLNFLTNHTANLNDAQFRLATMLLNFWSANGWFPSLTTLAKLTGWDKRKVRKTRDQLVAMGFTEYEAGDGRTNSDYTLHTAAAWWKARGDSMTAPRGVQMPTEGATISPPISLPETSSLSAEQNRAQKAARIRQLLRAVPDEMLPTVKALQQVPTNPGCSYEKLVPKVLDAAQRCGPSAVDDLYQLVANERGRLPAWQLYRMLDNMRPHSDQRQAEGSDTLPEPVEEDAFKQAKRIVERAHESVRGQLEVQARIRAGGGTMQPGWWADRRHCIAQELARVMAGGG